MGQFPKYRNYKLRFLRNCLIPREDIICKCPPHLREEEDDAPAGPKVTFADFLSDSLAGNAFNGTWISGETQDCKL